MIIQSMKSVPYGLENRTIPVVKRFLKADRNTCFSSLTGGRIWECRAASSVSIGFSTTLVMSIPPSGLPVGLVA